MFQCCVTGVNKKETLHSDTKIVPGSEPIESSSLLTHEGNKQWHSDDPAWDPTHRTGKQDNNDRKDKSVGLSGFGLTLLRWVCRRNCVWSSDTQRWQVCACGGESVTVWRPIQKWHTHTDCTHSGVFVLDASHPVTFLEDATWRHFILTKDQCVLSAVNPKPHSDIINLGVWMDVTDVLWAQVWSDLGVYFLPDDAIEDPQHELTWIWEP